MKRIRMRYVVLAIVLGLALAGGVIWAADATTTHTTLVTDSATPSASVEPTTVAPVTTQSADARMDAFLDQHNNPADQHERMRDLGRSLCRLLGTTSDYNAQVEFAEMRATMTPDAAKMFLNASIDIYCPVYADLIPSGK